MQTGIETATQRVLLGLALAAAPTAAFAQRAEPVRWRVAVTGWG